MDRWHDIVGNPTLVDAILDRFIHNAHRIELKGESLRKQRASASPGQHHHDMTKIDPRVYTTSGAIRSEWWTASD